MTITDKRLADIAKASYESDEVVENGVSATLRTMAKELIALRTTLAASQEAARTSAMAEMQRLDDFLSSCRVRSHVNAAGRTSDFWAGEVAAFDTAIRDIRARKEALATPKPEPAAREGDDHA